MFYDNAGLEYIIISIVFSLLFAFLSNTFRRATSNMHSRIDLSRFFMIMSYLCIWIVPAIRFNVGIDNDNYLMQYQNIRQFSDIVHYYEPGFGLLNYICYILFDNYVAVTCISSLITGAFFWKSIYRDAWGFPLCIFALLAVNLYFMSFTVIRQFIAISILTLSIPHIMERNFKRFCLIIGIATCFHYTAIVFLVMYFIYSDSLTLFTWKNICAIILFMILLINIDVVFPFISKNASRLREGYTEYEGINVTKRIIEVVVYFPVLLYVLIFKNRLIALNKINSVYIIMTFILIASKIIGLYAPALSRIHYYFLFCIPILFSYAPRVVNKSIKPLFFSCIYIYISLSLLNIFEYQSQDFLPYRTIFE